MSVMNQDVDRIFSLRIYNDKLQEVSAWPVVFKTDEGLSHSQKFILEFESPSAEVDLDGLLGENVQVLVRYRSGVLPYSLQENEIGGSMANIDPAAPDEYYWRYYNAYVTAGYDLRKQGNKYIYQLELSTWLWFLRQNRNSRIFQDKNILDVVKETFSRYQDIANYELEIDEEYPVREYCVQFGETDFNFINRLLEEEGIWYYFRHQQDKHTMVITDRQPFADLPGGYDTLPYAATEEDGRPLLEAIQAIHRSRKVRPNEVILRDYNYLHPSSNLQIDLEAPESGLANVQLEWYDYAAGYSDKERGEKLARLRLQMMQSERQLLSGDSNAIGLIPGYAFTLFQHPDSARNRRFKLIAARYTYIQGESDSVSAVAASGLVTCQFTALNDDIANRPPLRTPRPEVPGLQSATVVGTPGSEVYTDEHARIRVHFHWDRYKSNEEDSSCWVRVVQAWAGKGWGVIAMPRVGQEVLITYVDGDLDRPMVTGIVYNGANPPPYNLPQQIGHTGIKSRSLQHGLPANNNEITLVDDRGNEQVIIHAERDMHNTVENDLDIQVDNNRFDRVASNYSCLFNNHYYLANMRMSYTGLAVQVTGIKKDIAALRCGMTMVDFQSTGMQTTFTGVDTSFTAIGTHLTGLETNITGVKISLTAMDNEAIAMKNKLSVMENSLIANKNSFVAFNNDFVGMDNSAIVNRNATVGVNNNITGLNTELYGINVMRTGSSLNLSGAEVSIVEARNENYGAYMGNMKFKLENSLLTLNNTAFEHRFVGLLMIS
ncbi:type VI secretion system tip protein TssI/VgrG [Enterobacter asburiae]|uniref:type VI secretion system Vgr family protein n=1 Tax=Scandinavium sp. UTDF21-P1B TaxID=3446379 RepID=UPI00348ED1A0